MSFADVTRHVRDGDVARVRAWTVGALADIAGGAVTRPAQRHPLGFVCLPVLRAGADGICVHLWPRHPTTRPTTSPVHCHSWDLLSFVLYGAVRNDVVGLVEDASAPTHRVFEVRSSGPDDELRATDRLVRAVVTASATSRDNEAYTLAAGRFHASALDGDRPTATLVLATTRPGAVDLSLGAPHGRSHRVHRQLVDADGTAHLARTAVAALRRSHERSSR